MSTNQHVTFVYAMCIECCTKGLTRVIYIYHVQTFWGRNDLYAYIVATSYKSYLSLYVFLSNICNNIFYTEFFLFLEMCDGQRSKIHVHVLHNKMYLNS